MMEVTAAVIWQGDRFLICQRPRDKYCGLLWEFPGGKIEPGETAEECIIRECREELGVTLKVHGEFYDTVQMHRAAGLTVEKANSIFAKGGYTHKEAECNIHANPFKRFEDMQMLGHTKTLGIAQLDEAVWKRLSSEEKAEIERVCDEKLEFYFEKMR